MSIVLLRFPGVETTPNGKSRRCPYCDSTIIQSWGQQFKSVRDSQTQEIIIHRYRCCTCGRTFRTYPEGIDRSLLSQRMHNLAALTFAMGLSVRQVSEAFANLGINMSRMTIYRDGREMALKFNQQGMSKYKQIYLMERTHITQDKLRAGVRLVIDLGPGRHIVLGILDEYNPRAVAGWLEPICAEIGAQVYTMDTGKLSSISADA
ncbi:MAG TPA: hypothetical protein VIO36_12225 [Anaerolineaceae bacterium]